MMTPPPRVPTTQPEISGNFYDGKTSRPYAAVAHVTGTLLRLTAPDVPGGGFRRDFEIADIKIASRLGNTPRSLRFADGGLFETNDNDAVDALEDLMSGGAPRLHRLESNLALAFSALVGVIALSAAAYVWGIPLAARYVARAIPPDVAYKMGEGTLETLDKILFEKSELSVERQAELRAGFSKMAEKYPELPLRLEFRKAGMPNAFALPNGTVIVTDELEEIVVDDDEIYAVLAHEMGHVEHRHTARLALESSAVALIVMVLFGDASQAAGVTASLPAIYANSSFSRAHETEADTFALSYMERTGQDPEAFARALEHLTEEAPAAETESGALEYLASHPATSARITRFRSAARRAKGP